MTEPINIEYKVIDVADVIPRASSDLGVIVLDTDQGQIGLHMKRAVFERLALELNQQLSREA